MHSGLVKTTEKPSHFSKITGKLLFHEINNKNTASNEEI